MEQIAFTDIRIGERIDRARLKPAWPTEGWTVERSEYRRVDLRQGGLGRCRRRMGFAAPRKLLRRMGARDAMQVVVQRRAGDDFGLHRACAPSTGLAGDASQMMGPTAAYSRRVGDALVTVVGEVPPAAVRSVANSVEFVARADGRAFERQARGRQE